MNPHLVFGILLALGTIWTVAWAMVLWRSQRTVALDTLEQPENRLRLRLLLLFGAIGIGLFIITLPRLPYRPARVAELGAPRIEVKVVGAQWAWMLSRNQLPAGVPIEFVVTALDVNHDFGIYDPDGRLDGQVQAMPGYPNRLVYVFRRPGTYTIRCLEYCGEGHHTMTYPLTVTAASTE